MEQNNDPQFDAIFARARKLEPEAPAFLETRVLAALRERQAARGSGSLRLWKALTALSGCVSLVLLLWIARTPRTAGGLSAPVDSAVVVRIEMGDLKPAVQIARVRIDLPSGVHFYSRGHRELASASSVVLSMDAARGRSYLPFAIRSDQAGNKPILVRFLDENSAVVGERLIDIRFNKGASKS